MTDKPKMGHVDFGENGTGKKLVAIHRYEDGMMDLETDDGVIYKNCFLKGYKTNNPSEITVPITTTESFEIKMGDVEIHKDNILKAFGCETQDEFAAKMQIKTIDSVD
jgi:hypothetical protein